MYDLHGGVGTKPLTAHWTHVILVHDKPMCNVVSLAS